MDVDRPVRGDSERSRGEDQPIGGDNERFGPRRGETIKRAFILQVIRLKYRQAAFVGEFPDRTRRRTQAPACRTVRLRHYQRDLVASGKQRRQRVRREIWRAGEN
jgi:hypothetical protein